MTTSPAKSHIVSDAEEEEAPVTTGLAGSEGKADIKKKKPSDKWGPASWAPEEDPLMGEFSRALLAGQNWDEIAVKGAVGAELVDPEATQKQLNIHYKNNQKMLEGLDLALGTAELGKDVKDEECKETADEEHATGPDVPVEDLFAHLEKLRKEIQANLEYSTKVFEALEEMAPGLIAAEQLADDDDD